MSFHLNLPPRVGGDDRHRLDALSAYLPQLVAQLNYALGFLEIPSAAAGAEIRTESSDNKVTSISDKSTNTQYPTSKAVYEYAVPQTRAVNGHALTEDVDVTADDIGAEVVDNKTTELTEESTDEQYPSAKTVFDAFQEIAVKDRIVEATTSGIWTVRKYASGIAECWATKSLTVAANGLTDWSGVFWAGETVNYPTGLFKARPLLEISPVYSGTAAFWTGQRNPHQHTKDAAVYAVMRPSNISNTATFYVGLHAIGEYDMGGDET